MSTESPSTTHDLPKGVMLNAYPDSIGESLRDTVNMLKRPEFADVFSLFYILPTFFNSDLDRGFSVIDYDRNTELVSETDLKDIDALNIGLKFDLVLNHLSVGSPQFQDMLKHGDESPFKDFFVNWNEFWHGHGEMGDDGYVIPKEEHLQKLFMRKPGLPILKVRFPDGSERPYWNTFYQEVTYQELSLKRPRFSWTRIKGESNVQGGGGNGSIEGRGTGRGIGGDGGSPKGDRSPCRRRGGRGGLPGAGAAVERQPEARRGAAAAAWRTAGGAVP